MDTEKLLASLLIHEGLRLHPYLDSTGHTTIGIGRNLTDDGITKEEAHYLCGNDIRRITRTLDEEIPWWRGLNWARQNVVAEMCFNLGWVGLSQFHRFLAYLEAQAFEHAAVAMMTWAEQVGQRAGDLAQIMRSGICHE